MSPSSFEVRTDNPRPGTHVFAVVGELDVGTAPELESGLEEALGNGTDVAIAIDLSRCEFIDSTGIALIVHTWQRLGDRGGMALCQPNDQVRRLLSITGVHGSIPVCEDVDDALAQLPS